MDKAYFPKISAFTDKSQEKKFQAKQSVILK